MVLSIKLKDPAIGALWPSVLPYLPHASHRGYIGLPLIDLEPPFLGNFRYFLE